VNHDTATNETGRTRGWRAAALTWAQLEQRLAAGATAVLPVGAACKAHGPHLPMDTDYRQAEWLAGALVARKPVLVWPTLSYGHYPAFVTYPGSTSLTVETFRDLAAQVLGDILRAGANRVVVLNTGLSTIAPLEEAARVLSRPGAVCLAHVYRGPRYQKVVAWLEEQAHGSHADEIETSIMLVVAPEAVDMGKAVAWGSRAFVPGPFNRTDPQAPNYSPTGVYGDATLARRDKGEQLLAAMLQDLDAVLAGEPW
jgi:creatinine amidohydrolase